MMMSINPHIAVALASIEATNKDRIEQLRAKLAARIDGTGKPYPGYAQNVEAIKAEIEKLEERLTYAEVEWPEGTE